MKKLAILMIALIISTIATVDARGSSTSSRSSSSYSSSSSRSSSYSSSYSTSSRSTSTVSTPTSTSSRSYSTTGTKPTTTTSSTSYGGTTSRSSSTTTKPTYTKPQSNATHTTAVNNRTVIYSQGVGGKGSTFMDSMIGSFAGMAVYDMITNDKGEQIKVVPYYVSGEERIPVGTGKINQLQKEEQKVNNEEGWSVFGILVIVIAMVLGLIIIFILA